MIADIFPICFFSVLLIYWYSDLLFKPEVDVCLKSGVSDVLGKYNYLEYPDADAQNERNDFVVNKIIKYLWLSPENWIKEKEIK